MVRRKSILTHAFSVYDLYTQTQKECVPLYVSVLVKSLAC